MDQTTKIIRIVVDSSKAVDGSAAATRALQALEQQAGSIDSTLARMEKSIASMGGAIKAQLILQLEQLGERLLSMAKSAIDAGARLDDLADRVQLSTRNFQALELIAARNGVSFDELEQGLGRFSQTIGLAAQGSKAQIDALDRLHVKILDVNGNLRPTADLMSEVAAKILAIQDPAARSAAMFEFFGRGGRAMIPVLQDMSAGLDASAAAAMRMGTMMDEHTTHRLKELEDSAEVAKLKLRAFVDEGLVKILDWYDNGGKDLLAGITFGLSGAGQAAEHSGDIAKAWETVTQSLGDARDSVKTALDEMVVAGVGFVARFLETFKALPDQLGKLMVDGMNAALDGLEKGLTVLNNGVATKVPWLANRLGITPGEVNLPRLSGGGASVSGYFGQIAGAGASAMANFRATTGIGIGGNDYAGSTAAARSIAAQAQMAQDEANARLGSSGSAGVGFPGVSNPPDAQAAAAQAEKIQKLLDTLRAAAAAQDAMTAAARKGDEAFQDQQAHTEALQKAIEAFGGKVDAANPKVQALAAQIEAYIKATKEGAAAQTFVVATTELEKQNDLLRAQIATMNEAPDVQARVIAGVKTQQEAQKAGNALTAEDVENRRAAIEANEKLKTQAEQLKEVQALWTEPLKQALRDIQTTATDAFDQILQNGNFSFQSLGQTFITIIRKMAAEFLALATVRPVMSVLVQGLNGIGLVSPANAAALGFPLGAGASSAGVAGATTGGFNMPSLGLGSLFSSGGGSSFLGSFGQWLNTPFTGPYAGIAPADMAGVPTLSGAAGAGLTPLGLLGGLGSIGFGALNLVNGNGSMGSTIGGLSGIIGGGLSLAASVGLIGSAFGPIGMGVGLLGGLLGGLFGGGGQQVPPMPALVYGSGGFGFGNQGQLYSWDNGSLGGGANMQGTAAAIGQSVLGLITQTGGTPIGGKLYGGRIDQGTTHYWNGQQWVGQNYIQAFTEAPGGGESQISTGGDIQAAGEQLAVQIFKQDVLNNAIKGIADSLQKVLVTALNTATPSSLKDTQTLVDFAKAYDQLGKAMNPVKDSVDQLNQKFQQLAAQASTYGLSLDPINAELAKETQRTAQDFIDNMLNPLAVQMRALNDERDAALASAQYIKDNITGVYVDIDKITAYYTQKQAQMVDQFYSGAVTNLQSLIQRLTYGDLANASPDTSYLGTKATYTAALAQAQGGDQTAITNLSSYAEAYATAARSYFASGPEYQAIVSQLRQDLATQVDTLTGASSSSSGTPVAANDTTVSVMANQYNQLATMFQQSQQKVDDLTSQLSELTAVLKRANLA